MLLHFQPLSLLPFSLHLDSHCRKTIYASWRPIPSKTLSGGRNWFFWGMSILPPDHGVLGILVSELYEFIIKITLTGSQIVHIYKIQHFTFKNRAFKLYTNIRELENYLKKTKIMIIRPFRKSPTEGIFRELMWQIINTKLCSALCKLEGILRKNGQKSMRHFTFC